MIQQAVQGGGRTDIGKMSDEETKQLLGAAGLCWTCPVCTVCGTL